MFDMLTLVVILLILIVGLGYFNEKVTKLTYEIALMLLSVILGTVITVIAAFVREQPIRELLLEVQIFDLEEFLMKGVLCFMLFAGSCHIKIREFRDNARPIGVLAFICTFLGALFYGLLFYMIAKLCGINATLPMCLMFGSITAPTDPIAATGILKKFGLPARTGFLIEGESLLNDGVGVALFACFSGIVTADSQSGFFQILIRQILGALLIGAAVTFVCYIVFIRTNDVKRKIYASLLVVSLSYLLCEHFGCSGAIASVVCGTLFATLCDREEAKTGKTVPPEYDEFWEIIDNLLNSALYVILGLSFVRILQMPMVLVLAVSAIIANLIARFLSLILSSWFMGPIPDGYDRTGFSKLLTWAGLRGGLSIALAMSTRPILESGVYHIALGCTYAIVFFTTIVQGLTMQKVYSRIGRKSS